MNAVKSATMRLHQSPGKRRIDTVSTTYPILKTTNTVNSALFFLLFD